MMTELYRAPGKRDIPIDEGGLTEHRSVALFTKNTTSCNPVRYDMCCPPWRQVFNLSVTRARIPQVKNSWPRSNEAGRRGEA